MLDKSHGLISQLLNLFSACGFLTMLLSNLSQMSGTNKREFGILLRSRNIMHQIDGTRDPLTTHKSPSGIDLYIIHCENC